MNIVPNTKYRIGPALWEEPRCYWQSGAIGKQVLLQELNSHQSLFEWELVKQPRSNFYKIKGSKGFIYLNGAKLTIGSSNTTPHLFSINQMGAYFTIAQKQNLISKVECEDGYLSSGTDIQIYAASLPNQPWSEWANIPYKDFRYLWKLDSCDIDPKAWMNDARINQNKKLNQLAICGTHDTCTWKWSSGNYSKTQDLTVLEQLKIGIRYLDIRLGDDFETYHGEKNDVSFNDVLKDIADFLAIPGSEQETIIMAINGGDGGVGYAADLMAVMDGTSSRVTHRLDWYYENRVPALSEVRGKVVLLRRYKDNLSTAPGINLSEWGSTHNNDTFTTTTNIGGVSGITIQDEYEVTQNSTKKGWIEKLLPKMASPSDTQNHWYINFTSAAKGEDPAWYSNDINPWLGAILNFHTFMNGTFVMDYPSRAIVDRIIRFNF